MLDERLGRRVGIQLRGIVLVVDVVADADKLAAVVGACQQDYGHAQDLGIRDTLSIGGISLEDELVDADGDGAD